MNLKHTGIGTRVINFIVDMPIIWLIAYILYSTWKWYVIYYHKPYFRFGWFLALALFVYYLVLEGLFARTPGKWFSNTKVVNKKGRRPSFGSIFIRSLARLTVIDMFFIPFIDKTLHDYLSNTDVVEN